MVHVDGSVTTCCLDEHLENRLGNLLQTPLSALWKGRTIHRWRLAQIRGDFADSGPLCTRCSWRSAGSYPPEQVERYLEETGEHELLEAVRRRR